VSTSIVFETHALSEDNGAGRASGWTHGPLSAQGRTNARELGVRRRDDGIDTVFASDLHRALETAVLAFEDSPLPILLDWRLRECDYGALTRHPAAEVHGDRDRYLEVPYPGGESWRQALDRVGRFLSDLPTRWGLEHFCAGRALDDLVRDEFVWQKGWEYEWRTDDD